MDQKKFDLVFSGKVAPGFELEQAKSNLQQLFRIDTSKIETLFSGSAVVLKKNLDSETANKYRSAMRKAGAVAFMVPVKQAEGNAAPQPAAKTPASDNGQPPKDVPPPAPETTGASFTTALGARANSAPEPRPIIDAPEFDLASAGADLLNDEERQKVIPVDVDISAITLSESSGNLIEEDEIQRPEPVKVKDLETDVAPAGSDVLRPEERPKVAKVEVDTSAISVAEAGGRLSKQSDPPPPAPNVDHIKLENQ